ncbi:MAG: CoA ester lyase [Hyphomonadaceae bacterium]|nr:CoA ester lyase [Hyphomonadaceae bacterium]
MSASVLAVRPRRSCLYTPGANAKALAKARDLKADALIFDLEDAVAPDAKAEARTNVLAAIAEGGYGAREIVVRVNALSTPWGANDIEAVGGAKPNAVLAPKVNSADDVMAVDEAMSDAGLLKTTALWVMIETPLSILNIKEIAAASKRTRLAGFVMGINDLAKDMRAKQTAARTPFLYALAAAVTAARAYGLTAIDGVYNDIPNTDGFIEACRQGLAFGFDGKTLIHPTQIEACNTVFAPSAEEAEEARAIVAAFEAPENAGKGVLKVNGKMTELLHLDQARRTLAIFDAVAAMG